MICYVVDPRIESRNSFNCSDYTAPGSGTQLTNWIELGKDVTVVHLRLPEHISGRKE